MRGADGPQTPRLKAASSAPPTSFVERARAEFAACTDPACGDRVSCESLARRWLMLARGKLGRPERQAMALRVSKAIRDMDLNGNGFVDEHEWMHSALMTETAGFCALVNTDLSEAMATQEGLLKSIIALFAKVDVEGVGSASYNDLMAQHALGQFAADGRNGRLLIRLGLQQASDTPPEFARRFISGIMPSEPLDQLPAVEATRVSYTQFLAYCVGRKHSEVRIRLYDLVKGMAPRVSPWLLGREVEGIWHTGVVAFGQEYFFTRDCCCEVSGKSSFGSPKKELHVGHTLWRQADLHKFIVREMKPIFNRETYDIVTSNCNHFADRLCLFLTGRHLPEEVLRQPEYLLVSGTVRFAKPILNWYLQDNIAAHELDAPTPNVGDNGRRFSPSEHPRPGTAVLIRSHGMSSNYQATPVVGVVCADTAETNAANTPDRRRDIQPATSAAGREAKVLVRYFEAGDFGRFHAGAAGGRYSFVEERLAACQLSELENAFSEPGYERAFRVLSSDSLPKSGDKVVPDGDEVKSRFVLWI